MIEVTMQCGWTLLMDTTPTNQHGISSDRVAKRTLSGIKYGTNPFLSKFPSWRGGYTKGSYPLMKLSTGSTCLAIQ